MTSTRDVINATSLGEVNDILARHEASLNGGSIAASALRNLLVPVGSRASHSYTTTLSDGTVTAGTSRYRHVALATAHGIVLVYANTFNNAGTEADGPQDITVAAAFEVNATRVMPVTFGGARQVVIKPGAFAVSDPVGINIAKGAAFFTRTFISIATAATKFPSGCDTCVSGNGEGNTYAVGGTDLTPVGSGVVTTASTRAYGPSMILGKLLLGYPSSVTGPPITPSIIGVVGDSIAAGTGDSGTFTDWGYIKRALNNLYSFQFVAQPSETVDGWMQQGGMTRFRRSSLLEKLPLTDIICELGINSISNAAIQTNILAVWTYLASFGAKVYQTTLTPQTTSTDSWATLANQTVTANEARRTAYNDWIRDGAPISGGAPAATGSRGVGVNLAGDGTHPLTGYFELGDLAESARNSGKWRVDLGTPTTDGTHPAAVVAAAMAAGVDLTRFVATT